MNKVIKLLIICSFACLAIASQASNIVSTQDAATRSRISLDGAWQFALCDTISGQPFNFRTVEVPHDWSREGEYSESYNSINGSLPTGKGVYTKTFIAGSSLQNKLIELHFDGVYRYAKVYLNDTLVTRQYDGYTSFYVDITSNIKLNSENTIRVEVDNSSQPNCRWYSGSGIYRHVWLNITNPLRIESYGTYITTPHIEDGYADMVVSASVVNSGEDARFTLRSTLIDDNGNVVATTQTNEYIASNKQYDLRHHLEVNSPKLWSPETPHCYSVLSEIVKDGAVIDSYSSICGIRSLRFDAKEGFFLNGMNTKFKGLCIHHDAGTFGAAVPEEVWEYRLSKLKEIGCNAIRTAHNPPAPEFLELCDRMGFLVMAEFIDKWDVYNVEDWYWAKFIDPYFRSEWQQNFLSTVRRDRNHPSIIFWSVGNETNDPGIKEFDQHLNEYCSFVRSLDPSRPVIAGMERGADPKAGEVEKKIDEILQSASYMDVIAMNYGEQWVGRMGRRNLAAPYVSTESYTYFNSSEYVRGASIERLPWLDVVDNSHNMGLFLWVGIDYLGESKWPSVGSSSGLLDINGELKERAYLYKSLWSETPTLRIATYKNDCNDFSGLGKWSWPIIEEVWRGSKGDTIDVVTYTSCERVELYLNNKKIGTKSLADYPNKIIEWENVKYRDGTLRAVGYTGGVKECEFELKTPRKAKKLEITYAKEVNHSDEYIFLNITALDSYGTICYDNNEIVSIVVSGGGDAVSLSNGDVLNHKTLRDVKECKLHKGECHLVIKRNDKNERINVTASSKSINNGKLCVEL